MIMNEMILTSQAANFLRLFPKIDCPVGFCY